MLNLLDLDRSSTHTWLEHMIRVAILTPDTLDYHNHAGMTLYGHDRTVLWQLAHDQTLSLQMGLSVHSSELQIDGFYAYSSADVMRPSNLSYYLFDSRCHPYEVGTNDKFKYLSRLHCIVRMLSNSSDALWNRILNMTLPAEYAAYLSIHRTMIEMQVKDSLNRAPDNRIRIDFNSQED